MMLLCRLLCMERLSENIDNLVGGFDELAHFLVQVRISHRGCMIKLTKEFLEANDAILVESWKAVIGMAIPLVVGDQRGKLAVKLLLSRALIGKNRTGSPLSIIALHVGVLILILAVILGIIVAIGLDINGVAIGITVDGEVNVNHGDGGIFNLLALLVGDILPNLLGYINDIIERTSCLDHIDKLHLLIGEWNVNVGSNLEVQVDSVDEGIGRYILALGSKEVLLEEFTVSDIEIASNAGELILDKTLNASILDHIHIRMCKTKQLIVAIRDLVGSGQALVLGQALLVIVGEWRVKSMGHLMADEHIVHLIGHILEDRKRENTILDIEGCGLGIAVVDNKDVLARQQATEH